MNINAKNSQGNSVLHLAVQNGKLDIVKKIAGMKNVCLHSENSMGNTPLVIAVQNRDMEMIRVLLDCGVHVDDCWESYATNTPSLEAAGAGSTSILKLLIEKGARKNMCDSRGENLLHYAVKSENTKTVDFLINQVDANSVNLHRETPLHLAVRIGSIEMVRCLLGSRKVCTLKKDRWGYTPWNRAMAMRKYNILTEWHLMPLCDDEGCRHNEKKIM